MAFFLSSAWNFASSWSILIRAFCIIPINFGKRAHTLLATHFFFLFSQLASLKTLQPLPFNCILPIFNHFLRMLMKSFFLHLHLSCFTRTRIFPRSILILYSLPLTGRQYCNLANISRQYEIGCPRHSYSYLGWINFSILRTNTSFSSPMTHNIHSSHLC